MNLSDVSGSKTTSESSISRAENRLSDIEEDIAEQGRQIENYIKKHQNRSNSKQLIALKSLYSLFKKEVNINLALRKQLAQTLPANQTLFSENRRVSDILTGFIRDLNFHYQKEFKNLNEITNFFLENVDKSIEVIQSKKLISEYPQKEVSLLDQCKKYTQMAEENSKHTIEYNDALSMKLVELNSEIEKTNTSCSILHNQIEEEKKKKEEFQHQIDLIEKKSSIYIQQIDYQRRDFDSLINKVKGKKEKRKQKLADLTKQINDIKMVHGCLTADIQKLQVTLAQANRERNIIMKKSNEEIQELRGQIEIYEKLLAEIIEQKADNKKKYQYLSTKRKELEDKSQNLEKYIDHISFVSSEWRAKLKAKNIIKQQIFDDIDRLTNALVQLQNECSTMDVEQYLDLKQRENENLMIENKKLESLLRVTIQNIIDIEKQNHKMKSQMLKFQQDNEIH